VLDREKFSPTSFGNGVAIPHSMNASTARSFLSVVVNDKPMAWGTQKVSLIDPAKVTQLTRSNTYDEFAGRLNDMIMGA